MRTCQIILLVALFGSGCHPGNPARSVAAGAAAGSPTDGRVVFAPNSPKLAQIRTGPAKSAPIPQDEVVAPGKLEINPNRISRIVLPVAGRIAAVEVRLGDAVAQGQELLRVESPEAEAAMSDYLRAEASQLQVRATLSKARADLERAQDLFGHGAMAQKDVLHAESDLTTAEAALKEALAAGEQCRRRIAILGLQPGVFGQQVVVRSPIAGKVLELKVVHGEYRNDTTEPLITVADLSTLWVTSAVPESSIRLIKQGELVRIELAAYPGEVFGGRVLRVADTVDPQTRCVQVCTELGNRAGRFLPEMFARIRHSHGTRTLPVVPRAAVVQAEGSSWVFVEERPGKFQRVKVETGASVGQGVAILSGIRAGERVVVDAAILLHGSAGGAS